MLTVNELFPVLTVIELLPVLTVTDWLPWSILTVWLPCLTSKTLSPWIVSVWVPLLTLKVLLPSADRHVAVLRHRDGLIVLDGDRLVVQDRTTRLPTIELSEFCMPTVSVWLFSTSVSMSFSACMKISSLPLVSSKVSSLNCEVLPERRRAGAEAATCSCRW